MSLTHLWRNNGHLHPFQKMEVSKILRGESFLTLHELRAQGKSIHEIVRTTGIARNTVRKYLRSRELPVRKPQPKRRSKLEPFKEYLRLRISQGVLNCVVLLEEIRQRGYLGGKSILKNFVKTFRSPKQAQAVMRFEVDPGEQAQVDWGVVKYQDEQGEEHSLYAFVFLLSYSRDCYVEFVEQCDLSTLLRCHIHAFEHFGGVPRRCLYDNMRTVVTGRDDTGAPKFQTRFLDFALTVGFQPTLCHPYRPQTKGRVERMVRYLKQNFVPGRRFTSLPELNQQVRAWCVKASERIHDTTKRRPCDMLLEERLQTFVGVERLQSYLTEERTVSRDGFVSYCSARYGVPWEYAGQQVEVLDMGDKIKILKNNVEIAIHPKSAVPGLSFRCPGQWDGIPMGAKGQKDKAMLVQVVSPEVQTRDLNAYDALAGGCGHD